MHHFHYVENNLYCEDVPLSKVAETLGTPFYLYSHATLQQHYKAFDGAFAELRHLTCFSMKSSSNLAIVRLFASLGSGVDIVSGGELFRALRAGVAPRKIVYSGVGKTEEDLAYALQAGILMFNLESTQEMERLNQIAGDMGKKARISIRVNPDVNPRTHPYISTGLRENKFGIDIRQAFEQYCRADQMEAIEVAGVSCHIGSQLTRVEPLVDALQRLTRLIKRLTSRGMSIQLLDLGGGLGITYDQEQPPHPTEYAEAVSEVLDDTDLTLILEPGRVITGNAGILVTKVLYSKFTGDKTFFIVDAAMNDLIRPSLYNSYHQIQAVRHTEREQVTADIVGPICESGDFLAQERAVELYEPGDLLAVMSSGAYGFSMSSNYNSRPRVCEVMVKGDQFSVIRERESFEDLIRGEQVPDFLTAAGGENEAH